MVASISNQNNNNINNNNANNNQISEQVTSIKDDVLIRELSYSYVSKNNYISDTFKD
jgi:hypothetical protein